jgi:hypothetical protein
MTRVKHSNDMRSVSDQIPPGSEGRTFERIRPATIRHVAVKSLSANSSHYNTASTAVLLQLLVRRIRNSRYLLLGLIL